MWGTRGSIARAPGAHPFFKSAESKAHKILAPVQEAPFLDARGAHVCVCVLLVPGDFFQAPPCFWMRALQVFVDCLSPIVRSRVRQVDRVCVKGSNQPMGLFTYDIALDGVAEGEWA